MPPTKKRARSPEINLLSSTSQSTSIPVNQNRLVKRRWRGPDDDRIKALQKLERSRRCKVAFQDTSYQLQIDTRVHNTVPVPLPSPLQDNPGPAALHSAPLLPAGGEDNGLEFFNDSPVSSHVPMVGSGLLTASSGKNNRARSRRIQHPEDHTSAWTKRRHSQAAQWRLIAIPRLIPTYLANRAATESGRLPLPPRPSHQCNCNKVALKVEMVTWDRTSQTMLSICECYPSGAQLIEMGYFPCAPTRPTLAIDINFLEFVSIASHHMAPNVAGWSAAIQSFLSIRGYLGGEKDSIRRRFGNALHWYRVLVAVADQEVDSWVRNTTLTVMTPPETTNATDRSGDTESSTPTSEPLGRIDTTSDMPSQSPLPFPLPKDFLRMDEHVPRADLPSMYLQRRCPLCFSGRPNLRTSAAQVIVCVDANFSQRRRHSRHSDPVDPHPDTHFLSEDDVESMRRVVENARPTDSRSNAKSWAKLPNDTLDDCEKAFTAAQGHIAKSSSAIFADTALMALLCRHDRPLFLVNMTSAGERQFYALALIKALFQHLPDNWVVGFLYDVACQLERSMRKHGFLPEYVDRMTFAVSVFHAFGHQWACQLVYHPRKSKGYGLSDGEGCERLWSAIRKMVPSLRSAGYWRRLFELDSQLFWFENQNLLELGRWVRKKISNAGNRRVEAYLRLQQSGVPLATLEREWKAQIDTQLASAPRQSKNIADRAIADILDKKDVLKTKKLNLGQARKALERKARAGTSQEIQDSEAEVESLTAVITQLEDNISKQMSALGITAKEKLHKLKGNEFLRLRMNSLALRQRIIKNLVARKFEMEKLERLVRYGDRMGHHDHAQLKQGLNRRKGGHERLVKSYDKLRLEMQDLIARGDGLAGATVPKELSSETLWDLDVDDELWMELARDEQYQDDAPKWLYDEPTKQGIRAMLDLERCEEELERLSHERGVMFEWLRGQEEQLQLASHIAQGNIPLLYQIALRNANLTHISRAWNMNSNIDTDDVRLSEGPTRQMEPGSTDSRPQSPSSSDDESAVHAIELWEDIFDAFQAQEDEFVQQDEIALLVAPGPLFDTTPVTPVFKSPSTPMSPKPSFQRRSVVPSLVSGPSPSSSASPPKPRRPLSPIQVIIPDLKGEYQPLAPPSRPHVKRAILAGQSVKTNPARESPSQRFFASPDQIDALGMPRTWLHGQVISTLGDTFCNISRSKPRHEHYDILPTDLFETWNSYMGGYSASRTNLSYHFKQAASPLECRAWLVPVLLESHWYLLVLDWIDSDLRIYDSLATSKEPHPSLFTFGGALVDLITEDLKLEDNDWDILPEQRGCRQKNGYDCGVYVLWDIYCLSKHGNILPKSPAEITAWRPQLHAWIQSLDPYTRKRKRPLETIPSTEPVINIDSD